LLFEYFCTGKPIIHLISPYSTNKPHTFLQKAFNTFYQIKSYDDMNDILEKVLINKDDYLKLKRLNVLDNLNISKNNASLNIFNDIKKDLEI
jgi:adenosine deaminase